MIRGVYFTISFLTGGGGGVGEGGIYFGEGVLAYVGEGIYSEKYGNHPHQARSHSKTQNCIQTQFFSVHRCM